MEPKFSNKTNASGIHVTDASPIDDRVYVTTMALLESLSNEEPFSGIMYDGLVIQVGENRKEFIWVESNSGIMANGYTYPEYMDDIQGQNYANKTFNLVLYDKVAKVDITYSDIASDGLFIADKYLPYHVLKNKAFAQVMMKSSTTAFSEMEFPDTVRVENNGITIILDPKPEIAEEFKITIL
jgi:hypothetical protein